MYFCFKLLLAVFKSKYVVMKESINFKIYLRENTETRECYHNCNPKEDAILTLTERFPFTVEKYI